MAEQDRQPAQYHHRRLGRQNEWVGNERHQRDALKVIGHDGNCSQLRGQREEHELREQTGGLFGGGGWKVARDDTPGKGREWRGIQDQPQRGKERKLKTHVPYIQRIPNAHQRRHRQQGVKRHLPAPHLPCQQRQAAHHCCAHHGRFGPNQKGIEHNTRDGRVRPTPIAEELAKEGKEDARDDADIETRNRNDMRRTSVLKGLLQPVCKAGIHAEQNARQQGRFRVGEQAIDIFKRTLLEGVQSRNDRVATFLRQDRHLSIGHIRVDTLRREIIAV